MPYYTKEEIARVREIDLLTYLQRFEPQELVHVSGSTYCTREHDSLKISNGKWMWWSRGFGGASALDYLIKVKEIPFMKAMEILTREEARSSPLSLSQRQAGTGQKNMPQKRLLLPERAENNDQVIRYLMSRGIDRDVISACIQEGLLYESAQYHNCVFVGYDREGAARYASFRASRQEKIMGEATGSDKRFAFRIDRPGKRIHVFEGAIDLLSFATIMKMKTGKWRAEPMVSLGGVYAGRDSPEHMKLPAALMNALDDHTDVTKITLHLDNDIAGRAAAESIARQLQDRYEIRDDPPPLGKDCNDYLMQLIEKQRSDPGRGLSL